RLWLARAGSTCNGASTPSLHGSTGRSRIDCSGPVVTPVAHHGVPFGVPRRNHGSEPPAATREGSHPPSSAFAREPAPGRVANRTFVHYDDPQLDNCPFMTWPGRLWTKSSG